jgi:hypothetical protein
MKQTINIRSRVEDLGKLLGLDIDQIHSVLNNTQRDNEHLSFSLGPGYRGSYYGTISINSFNIPKQQ